MPRTVDRHLPRYEFRIFGRELDGLEARLAARAVRQQNETTDESYIASRLTIDAGVKIRDGRLEVKLLVAREGLLELWRPELMADLPIEARTFAVSAAAPLGVEVDIPDGTPLGIAEIRAICDRYPSLAWVDVVKRRTRYVLPQGLAEVTRVEALRQTTSTIAVEDSDIASANGLARELGLTAFDNESYPAWLQRIAF
jgi:hypothetical protein